MPEITWIIIVLLFVPWAMVTLMWYVSLGYRLLYHREQANTTTDFSIKILTVGNNLKTLARTVSRCPVPPLIISRNPTGLPGTHVIPDDFDSRAQFKGEQLEWARRAFPRDYTLYLDEDSICSKLMREIPDADIVQFRETPIARNWYTAAIEAHRIGFQSEQAIFEKIKPFYLWGGGFAVKRWVEDATTWDRESITEDTAFIFAIPDKARVAYSKIRVYNQAPQTLGALISQRRRWASGIFSDLQYHRDTRYKVWVLCRTINWAMWPLLIPASLLVVTFHPIFLIPVVQTMIWSYVGAREMRLKKGWMVLALLTAPLAALAHSMGATISLVSRQKTFNVTPKFGFKAPKFEPSMVPRPITREKAFR